MSLGGVVVFLLLLMVLLWPLWVYGAVGMAILFSPHHVESDARGFVVHSLFKKERILWEEVQQVVGWIDDMGQRHAVFHTSIGRIMIEPDLPGAWRAIEEARKRRPEVEIVGIREWPEDTSFD